MKIKEFNNGTITISWDRDIVKIYDMINSFSITFSKSMVKYFIYCTEILYKINNAMGSSYISFHSRLNRDVSVEHITQDILNQFRHKGYIAGNYMDIDRKDFIVSCFKKCFKTKQEKIKLEDINLQNMPLTVLIYIKKGLL